MLAKRWRCKTCGFVVGYGVKRKAPSRCMVCEGQKYINVDPQPKPNMNFEDKVHQPSHYTAGQIEVIDYIKDKLTTDKYVGYCVGNVLKYVSRYELKNGVEDLEKAAVYLKWAIEVLKDGQNSA